MRNLSIYIILFLFIGAAAAQQKRGASPRKQLQREMALARYLLQENPDPEAEKWVRQAEKLQREMQSLLEQQRFQEARKKGMRAHDLAVRAVRKLSRIHLDRLRREVNDLIRRAQEIVPGGNDREALRLLHEAQKNIENAAKEEKKEQYRKAFELLRTAKFQAERSLLLVKAGVEDIDATIREEHLRFQNLSKRADELLTVCDNPQAKKLYRQALEQKAAIARALEKDDKELALDLYYRTTRLLLRVIDLCQGINMSLQEQAEHQVATLGDLLDRAERQGLGRTPIRRRAALKKAYKLQEKARVALANRNYELALKQARQAVDVLNRQFDVAGNKRENRLQQELRRLFGDIKKAKNSPKMNDARKGSLIDAADLCAGDAEEFLKRGDESLALQAILAGNRLLLQSDSDRPGGTMDAAKQELQKLTKEIDRARQHETNVSLVVAADRAAVRAQAAISSGHVDAAFGFIRLGQEILKLDNP